ncbi:MAG: toll/interleukin-1 receptor domain-containing protein [Brevundimonas sp.]|jgi:hypothetical protein|nr:toll/interleukin-1 receptor domain-containing protein [Brevundimonas sp.]
MNQPSVPHPAAHYRAFVSYSHTDADFAVWLHRSIERFRLTPESGQGLVERLVPVFIDRAELPAAPDLSAQVKQALADSAALIVVASPRARASRWVDQEITLFRTLHPDRPVLAALIDGDPETAFPAALSRHGEQQFEPLAADFRKGADGRQLGLLKIVAGLTGRPLDRLVQRDAQDRQRRVMFVTAAAVTISLILAALLALAIRARAEAERQRASAEGMVEFMLTDLRQDLKGAASLKVMDAVNARAMAHYTQQDLSALPADSLTRRARLLQAMGEDEAQRGQFGKAQRKFIEAERTTAAVLAQRPDDPEAIFAHAQSEYWVGYAAWQQGDYPTTERHWQRYLDEAEALAKREPGQLRSFLELGYANGNLCEVTMARTDRAEQALPRCEAATAMMRQAAAHPAADDQTRLALANRLGWQADILRRLDQSSAARALRLEEAAIVNRLLVAEPDDLELRERRLWPEIGLVSLEYDRGDVTEATKRARQALAAYDQLARQRPGDVGLNVQRWRLALIAVKGLRAAKQPDREFLAIARQHYAVLQRAFPPRELERFSSKMAQLDREQR